MASVGSADVVIIGAGPAGLAAAAMLLQHGVRTLVVDELPFAGGRAVGQEGLPGQIPGPDFVRQLVDQIQDHDSAALCLGASVWDLGQTDDARWRVLTAPVDGVDDNAARAITAQAVIVATGAVQRPVPMPGWTLPGVITPGAVQRMLKVDRTPVSRRCAVVGINPLAIEVAEQLHEGGIEVCGVILPPYRLYNDDPSTPDEAFDELLRLSKWASSRALGVVGQIASRYSRSARKVAPAVLSTGAVDIHWKTHAVAIGGRDEVEWIDLVDHRGRQMRWDVDTVVMSAGISPLVEAAELAGCPSVLVPELGGFVPLHNDAFETSVPGLFVAGSITGVEGREVAAAQGRGAAVSCLDLLGRMSAFEVQSQRTAVHEEMAIKRKSALPFLAHVETGKEVLRRHWASAAAPPRTDSD